ncbi:MAG: hypothetical protein JOZ38_07295, partial [Candidatus Eremiobacteraeota bacterium]|nr:hypothetical protein [Candidatus Eremiobacteraeota bacterium]
ILVWRIVGIEWTPLLRTVLGVSTSTLFMVFALRWIDLLRPLYLGNSPAALTEFLIGQMIIGTALFFAIARLTNNEELQVVFNLVMEKLSRDLPSAPENRESPIA